MTYGALAIFARVAVRVYLPRITVTGVADIPRRGGLIIVSNRLDYADPGVLMANIPWRVVFLAMRALFHWPVIGLLPRLLGALPVDARNRQGGNVAACCGTPGKIRTCGRRMRSPALGARRVRSSAP